MIDIHKQNKMKLIVLYDLQFLYMLTHVAVILDSEFEVTEAPLGV